MTSVQLRRVVQKQVDVEGLIAVAARIGVVPVTLRTYLLGGGSRRGTVAQIEQAVRLAKLTKKHK